MAPVPIEISNTRFFCAITAPESATSAFAMISPSIFTSPPSRASVATTAGLSPSARKRKPALVFMNRSRSTFTTSTMTSTTSTLDHGASAAGRLSTSALSKRVSMLKKGRLARPAMRRLMEYSPVMVMMPLSRSRTRHLTWISPVTSPATAPASVAIRSVSTGCMPFTVRMALTAAPSGKDESTVRSGKSRMR